MSPEKDFLVFAPGSRQRFDVYTEALNTATELGKKLVEDYMKECGLSGDQVEISIEKRPSHLKAGTIRQWKQICL